MTTPPSLRTQVAASLALLIVLLSSSSPCLAFVLPTNLNQITHPQTPLCSTPTKEHHSTKEQQEQLPKLSLSSLDKLQVIKQALKRPRGASIGVQYSPTTTLSDGDLSIFSMQLRKTSKSSAIYTCDVESLSKIVKEQESSRGDFPGPVPVIYYGTDAEKLDSNVVESASAVVIQVQVALERRNVPLRNVKVRILYLLSHLVILQVCLLAVIFLAIPPLL